MKLIHRLGFYLGGFAVGLIFLAFFLSGKRASCDYGPQARVLKNITNKPFHFSNDIAETLQNLEIDSIGLITTLREGHVNFKRSNTSLDSCKTYVIESSKSQTELDFTIANCDSIAKIIALDRK